MSRSRFGVGLLVMLLLLGIWCQQVLVRKQAPIQAALEQTAAAAYREDWTAAGDFLAQARKQWDTYRNWGAVFTHHADLEAADAQFAVLDVFCRKKDALGTASAAAQLASQVEALGESHRLTWKNLL